MLQSSAVARGLIGARFFDQSSNPVQRKLVRDVARDALIVRDLVVEFFALIAHGSPQD